MTVSASEFLDAAEHCSQIGSEAGYRSCISRAYYSMFHEALNSLTCVPNYSSNHHSNLIGYMTNAAENKAEPYDKMALKVLGYNLKQQRGARNEADYHLSEVTISSDMAALSVEAAKLFFSKWHDLKAAKAS